MREREERILAAAAVVAERAAAYRQAQDRVLLLREQWERLGEQERKLRNELMEAECALKVAAAEPEQ